MFTQRKAQRTVWGSDLIMGKKALEILEAHIFGIYVSFHSSRISCCRCCCCCCLSTRLIYFDNCFDSHVCFRWYFFGGANQYTQTHNKRYMIFILYLIDNDCLSFDRRKIKNLNRATHPNITRFETKPLCANVSVCVEGNRQPKTTKKYLERERETENGYKWEKQIMCMLKSH